MVAGCGARRGMQILLRHEAERKSQAARATRAAVSVNCAAKWRASMSKLIGRMSKTKRGFWVKNEMKRLLQLQGQMSKNSRGRARKNEGEKNESEKERARKKKKKEKQNKKKKEKTPELAAAHVQQQQEEEDSIL